MLFTAAILATAAAVAPPRIELDLSAMSNAYKLASSVVRSHDLGYQQTNGAAVMSRQDWSEKCPAGATTNPTNCPFPSAKAWDHTDQDVDVTTRVKLVDEDGASMDVDVNQVNFLKRSTYLFRYDAHDTSGNRAEQVIFALILDDVTAPSINVCGGASENVEAASDWTLCAGSVAADNIDVLTAADITYTIQAVNNAGSGGVFLCQDASHATAATKITTEDVGQWLVTLCASDSAGVYGTNAVNNKKCESKAVRVSDTRPPIINIHGANPLVHECATTYVDQGATATDLLDTVALNLPCAVTAVSTVDSSVLSAAYTVTYTASDNANNPATPAVRAVSVTDTTNPVIALIGDHEVVHYSGNTRVDSGTTCTDTCDSAPTTLATTWSRPWNDKVLGEYIATYQCNDGSTNSDTITRKYTIIDQSDPVITIVGDEIVTHEATLTGEYTDQGATCQDYVDGILSHAVEVSGQIVNMRIPGSYEIRYDCQDISQNQAVQMTRTVVIEDTTCPTVQLRGQDQVIIEAGFPYVDAGATASDTLDGDITSKVWTDGDTVDISNAFYTRRSCREIKALYAGAGCGNYWITTTTGRTQVWCDMMNGALTYKSITGASTAPYTSSNDGDCPTVGLKMAVFATTAAQDSAAAKYPTLSFAAGATDAYLCSTNDAVDADLAATFHAGIQGGNHVGTDAITRAETGKYEISYHVNDAAGNTECTTEVRTVIVKDTLPPVITLHLKNQLIHTSAHTAGNPAGDDTENPHLASSYTGPAAGTVANSFPSLMAEQAQTSSVNGWVIGAVASAVSGLALLANTLRKTDAAVSVPV
jgi:hypothetical protein